MGFESDRRPVEAVGWRWGREPGQEAIVGSTSGGRPRRWQRWRE